MPQEHGKGDEECDTHKQWGGEHRQILQHRHVPFASASRPAHDFPRDHPRNDAGPVPDGTRSLAAIRPGGVIPAHPADAMPYALLLRRLKPTG